MNRDMITGKWKQITGMVKENWGQLLDDEITVVEGKRDQIAGKALARYGTAKEKASKQVKDFLTHM